jgi:pimeloyl-ACP methyl ester carboxylesterase
MGGLMGIMLAARRHSPIRRLVLNDVGPLVPWPALVQMKQAHSGLHATFASSEEAEAHLRKVCASFGPITDAQWRRVARHSTLRKGSGYILAFDPAIITHMRPSAAPGVEFGGEFLTGVDLWPTYDAIRCPTLVLRGSESSLLPGGTAEQMTRRGPKAKLVEFAGVGHAPWLMAEDQIKIVRDFLLAEPTKAAARPPTTTRHRT